MLSPKEQKEERSTSAFASLANAASSFLPNFSSGDDAEQKEQSSRRNSRNEETVASPRSNGQTRPLSGSTEAEVTASPAVTLPLPPNASAHGSPLGAGRPDSSDGEVSPTQGKSAPTPQAGAREGERGYEPAGAGPTFADQLAGATQRAPQRLAERLLEQLKHDCLEEASKGQSSYTWDMQLPSNSRSFMHQVARSFASRVEALGFEQVEWWNGREWSKQSRQYHIIHDPVYEKYHMKIRVRWLDRPRATEAEEAARRPPSTSVSDSVVEQFKQLLDLQRQFMEHQLAQVENGQMSKSDKSNLPAAPELSGCLL
ncbi:unnamed protein product [Durusdinium trenchii]